MESCIFYFFTLNFLLFNILAFKFHDIRYFRAQQFRDRNDFIHDEYIDYFSESIKFERYNALSYDKEPLLFISGLDLTCYFSELALNDLSSKYDVWMMKANANDRTTFTEAGALAIRFISRFKKPVVLVGESFGGLLASYVAVRARDAISNLVLLNPSSSYDRTLWPLIGPYVANAGRAYGISGVAVAAVTMVQPNQIITQAKNIIGRIRSVDDSVREAQAIINIPKLVTSLLPAETLKWRLRAWLMQGSHIMKDKYANISTPTLILVGAGDRLIPSSEEGRRLLREMKNAQVEVKEYPQGGHLLLDGTFNLTDIFRESKLFPNTNANPMMNPVQPIPELITDYYPSQETIEEFEQILFTFRRVVSPVMLTRRGDGSLKRGIMSVPVGTEGRPVLLVGNHQLYGKLLKL